MTAALIDREFQRPRESMTVCESSGVHFTEIEVSGKAAFESMRPLKSKCMP
jgi:hypothetical protein